MEKKSNSRTKEMTSTRLTQERLCPYFLFLYSRPTQSTEESSSSTRWTLRLARRVSWETWTWLENFTPQIRVSISLSRLPNQLTLLLLISQWNLLTITTQIKSLLMEPEKDWKLKLIFLFRFAVKSSSITTKPWLICMESQRTFTVWTTTTIH